MAASFDRKNTVALLLALVLFVALLALGAQSVAGLRRSLALVEHARDTRLALKETLAALVDMETAQRGYLLALDERFLEPYVHAAAVIDARLRHLGDLVAGEPQHETAYEELRGLAAAKQANMQQTISLARQQGIEPALEIVRSGQGKALMDEARRVLAGMEAVEVETLRAGMARAEATVGRSVGVASTLAAAAATMLLALHVLMRREAAARRASARAQALARAELERRVEERTRDLARVTEALERSEVRLRGIFESATDAIVTVDENQRVVLANPAAAAMLRCPLPQLVGSPLERFIPERFRAGHRKKMEAFGASGETTRTMSYRPDLTALRCDGEEFPVDIAISQLEVGGQHLYTAIVRDMTARRRAEDELRRGEALLRRILLLMPETILIHTGGRISFVNAAAQRLFGRDESELLGSDPMRLVHPDSLDTVRARIARALTGADVPVGEVEVVRADGSVRTVESTGTRIDDHGGASVLVVLRDITELKAAQAEVASSHADLQRLVAAQESVRENECRRIARELHDDLQQTLAAIKIDLGAAQSQLATAPATVGPILADAEALAGAAIASTRRIVNDLRPRILDDLGLVPALQAMATQFSQRTGIDCGVHADEEAERRVAPAPAATTCLYRVAQEALNNVAKHANATTASIELRPAPDGGLELRIDDDGRGLEDHDRRKPQSFGLLGMNERVRAQGGTLRIVGNPGDGTTVTVTLPGPAEEPDAGPSDGVDTP
jgi:two-component system sensor histidine kinase UhpB